MWFFCIHPRANWRFPLAAAQTKVWVFCCFFVVICRYSFNIPSVALQNLTFELNCVRLKRFAGAGRVFGRLELRWPPFSFPALPHTATRPRLPVSGGLDLGRMSHRKPPCQTMHVAGEQIVLTIWLTVWKPPLSVITWNLHTKRGREDEMIKVEMDSSRIFFFFSLFFFSSFTTSADKSQQHFCSSPSVRAQQPCNWWTQAVREF